jgi:hypothetical protein
MCIRIVRNNSQVELSGSMFPSSNQPVTPELNICNEVTIDAVKLKNLPKTSGIPSAMVSVSGLISGNTFTTGVNRNIINSSEYKTEITSLVYGLHSELKAINKITPKQLMDIQSFDLVKRDMFITSIQELESLKARKTNAAGYMMNIMKHAADLAGNDNKKFVNLVGEMFSDIPIPLDWFRKILGAGPHTAGNLLEPMLDKVVEEQGGSFGFNANITDDIDSNNTMTHHVGEFLQVGYNRGSFIGKLAANIIDRNTVIIQDRINEGDIRSGSFSAMVGAALKDKTINPQDAVKLFSWAFTTDNGGKYPPPFGATETEGKNLKFSDYKIENWIKDYNKAFPDSPIISLQKK